MKPDIFDYLTSLTGAEALSGYETVATRITRDIMRGAITKQSELLAEQLSVYLERPFSASDLPSLKHRLKVFDVVNGGGQTVFIDETPIIWFGVSQFTDDSVVYQYRSLLNTQTLSGK
ncbi:hypothetical protein [Pseudomonas fluorescens]|uniref:hypothetical protein n=1 Tax=Pseudomonas fluorescens TaxID=294 RepID=UPI0005C4DFCF|nr:hypothetical protein [Pseudomonas fluorescens]